MCCACGPAGVGISRDVTLGEAGDLSTLLQNESFFPTPTSLLPPGGRESKKGSHTYESK